MSAALAALAITTSSALAFGPDDYIGTIGMTAAEFCPSGTVEANGQILSRHNNEALFVLYGATYGGDGRTTFGVPDMRGRVPVGTGWRSPEETPIYLGQEEGHEYAVLDPKSLPSHTHTAVFTRGIPINPIRVDVSVSSNTTVNTYIPSESSNHLSASPAGPSGGNMWGSAPGKNPVNLAGVSSTGKKGDGKVVIADAGSAQYAAIPTIPPQLGMRFCIVTDGTWPGN